MKNDVALRDHRRGYGNIDVLPDPIGSDLNGYGSYKSRTPQCPEAIQIISEGVGRVQKTKGYSPENRLSHTADPYAHFHAAWPGSAQGQLLANPLWHSKATVPATRVSCWSSTLGINPMQRAIGHVPGRLCDFQAQLVGSCSRSEQ